MVHISKFFTSKMIRLFEEKSHVQSYALHRPTWPKKVVTTTLGYLNRRKERLKLPQEPDSNLCSHLVDVGCGSGQSTPLYAPHCKTITGLDPSAEQIKVAKKNNQFDRINYVVGSGEHIPLPNNSVELVCCAQAVHWLDWNKFFKECKRVLVPYGCMATYGYTMPKIELPNHSQEMARECNKIFQYFYKQCRFHPVRRHVDNKLSEFYAVLPCQEKCRNDDMVIRREWNIGELQGYISTWSGYRKLEEEKNTTDILPDLIKSLKETMGEQHADNENVKMNIIWDIFMILSSRPI